MSKIVDKITIDGVDYARVWRETPQAAKRAVVVIDRGWIYAGDVSESEDGERLILSRAVWVFKWESIGFSAVIDDPTSDKVDIRKMSSTVEVPKAAELFRIPVSHDWGLDV